jgi:hypothetical protein
VVAPLARRASLAEAGGERAAVRRSAAARGSALPLLVRVHGLAAGMGVRERMDEMARASDEIATGQDFERRLPDVDAPDEVGPGPSLSVGRPTIRLVRLTAPSSSLGITEIVRSGVRQQNPTKGLASPLSGAGAASCGDPH